MCIHWIKFIMYQYMYDLLGTGHNHMISKSLEVYTWSTVYFEHVLIGLPLITGKTEPWILPAVWCPHWPDDRQGDIVYVRQTPGGQGGEDTSRCRGTDGCPAVWGTCWQNGQSLQVGPDHILGTTNIFKSVIKVSFLNLFIWWYYIALRSCLPVISIVMVQDIKLTKIRCYVALLLHMYICFRVVYFNKVHHKKSKSVIFLSLLLLHL